MPKCIGCKVENSLTEYKKRRNVTSLMSMRNAVHQFTNVFSQIPEGLITSVYPGMCEMHLGHFAKLMEVVSALHDYLELKGLKN